MTSQKLRISIFSADAIWMSTIVMGVAYLGPAAKHAYYPLMNSNFAVAYLLGASLILWSVLYSWLELDGFQRGWSWASMTSWLTIGVLMLLPALMGAILPLQGKTGLIVIVDMVWMFYPGFVLIRVLARCAVRGLDLFGRTRRLVILGDGRVARELASQIDEHPELLTEVVGFFSAGGGHRDRGNNQQPGGLSTLQIVEVLKEKSITDLVVVLSQSTSRETASLASLCREADITVSLIPEHYDLYASRPRLFDIGGVPLLQVEQPSACSRLLLWKAVIDFPLALFFGMLAVPLLAVAALHVYVRQGRVLERETRCGRNGRRFSLYRLAVPSADPANSWFDRLLERTSLTELPQFWNVLCGDMSLVGPRPETPTRIQHYSDWHRRRLSVKPGITGWAQVHGLRNGDSSDEKTRYDLYYILNWSPLLDCVVLLQTGWTLLSRLQDLLLGYRHTSAKPREQSGSSEGYVNSAQPSAN